MQAQQSSSDAFGSVDASVPCTELSSWQSNAVSLPLSPPLPPVVLPPVLAFDPPEPSPPIPPVPGVPGPGSPFVSVVTVQATAASKRPAPASRAPTAPRVERKLGNLCQVMMFSSSDDGFEQRGQGGSMGTGGPRLGGIVASSVPGAQIPSIYLPFLRYARVSISLPRPWKAAGLVQKP